MVLDFSSGTAQVVENTATKIEELSEEETVKAAGGAFSKFRELIAKVDIVKEVEDAGNVTIFTPFNKAFDKLPTKLEDLPLSTQRKLVLKHFVKGFLLKKDMKNGPVSYIYDGSKLGFPLSRDFSNFQVPGLLDFFSPGTTGPWDLQGL